MGFDVVSLFLYRVDLCILREFRTVCGAAWKTRNDTLDFSNVVSIWERLIISKQKEELRYRLWFERA